MILSVTKEHFVNDLIGALNLDSAQSAEDKKSAAFIRQQLLEKQTSHSTIGSFARQFIDHRLRTSPFLMEFVIRMLFSDFELFQFPVPKMDF